MDAWYAWFENGNGNTITASYVYHPCNKAGRHTKDRYNCYFMQMDSETGKWTTIVKPFAFGSTPKPVGLMVDR